jgi:hypothetical protein
MSSRRRGHGIAFERQVVAAYHAGETLYALAKRCDQCRNLARIWIEKAEAGAFDDETATAHLLTGFEAKVAALRRRVGRQALEIEFLKVAVRSGPSPTTAPSTVINDPTGSRSDGGASRWVLRVRASTPQPRPGTTTTRPSRQSGPSPAGSPLLRAPARRLAAGPP